MPTLYAFEAKSIQKYIFQTNKLKQMVGASALVDQLCTELLDHAIDQGGFNLDKEKDFARKAGGAFLTRFMEHKDAVRFRDFWSFYVQRKAPGLNFVHALVEMKEFTGETLLELNQKLFNDRNRTYLKLPPAAPLALRAALTGEPAVYHGQKQNHDAASWAKLQFANSVTWKNDLAAKLNLDGHYEWPKLLTPDDEPGSNDRALLRENEENRYVGVIHADGNDLGNILTKVKRYITDNPQNFPTHWLAFSKAVENATIAATKKAASDTLIKAARGKENLVPARFLVLGGDDLTLVVKGDLAIPFTRSFLQHFEQQTKKHFDKLPDPLRKLLPQRMSACAGIAFIKANQPFHMAYELAESLCKAAKNKSKEHRNSNELIPSSLAFHRITTAMIDDWDTVLKREMTIAKSRILSMCPYQVPNENEAPNPAIPSFSDLQYLTDCLAKAGHGPLRELARLVHQSDQHAKPALRRWKENLNKQNPSALKALEPALESLLGPPDSEQAKDTLRIFNPNGYSPIADVLALHAVGDYKEDRA